MAYHKERLPKLMEDYITWSFAYYQHDRSLVSDNMFDTGCLLLRDNYGSLPDWFTELVSLEDLKAGTGFTLNLNDFPSGVAHKAKERIDTEPDWSF